MDSNCLFLDIIGNLPDENENTNKINGYYQVTNGILINNLAKLCNIEKKQVKIFAYGDKCYYEPFIYTNNKCYHQFGLNDVFQMNASSHNFDFNYFVNFEDTLSNIDKIIRKNINYTTIIIFLDDHGSKGKFSKKNYFKLYKIFLKYPKRYFLVFNDSCFSGSFINLIETYNKIYELKIYKQIDDEACLQLIYSFTKLLKSVLKYEYPIQKAFYLIDLYQKNKINDQNRLKKVLDLISSNEKSIEKINKIGFQSIEEIENFWLVYNSFRLNEKTTDADKENFIQYQKSLEVFSTTNLCTVIKWINNDLPKSEDSENILDLKKLINSVNTLDLQEFINAIDILDASKESINFELPPSQNVEIISSTDDKSKSFSYTSIRTNSVTKVYPGSPAMNEFLQEIFISHEHNFINFDKIKKEICGSEQNTIYYSVRDQTKSSNDHIKKEWANLFPQHYRPNKENQISLSFSEETKRKIAALRAISFIICNRFKEISTNLSVELDQNVYNKNNDPIADLVAIAALIGKSSNINEIMNKSIKANKFFKKQDLLEIGIVLPIVQLAFYSKKDHLQMMVVIMNCINEAILKEINKNIDLINENDILKFISNKESSYFIENANNHPIEKDSKGVMNSKDDGEQNENNKKENQKLEIINEVRNAIFALLDSTSTFFAYIVASSILDDIDIDKINSSKFITNSSKENKLYQVFLQNINSLKELEFRKLAENYLFSYVKLALQTLNSLCDMHIKNDAMKVVARGLQNQNSLFLIQTIAQNVDTNDSFITNIIEPIENIISSQKISSFFIPAIIEFIPPKNIISILYASFPDLQNNWYENVINILKKIIQTQNTPNNMMMNYQYIDENHLLGFANDALNMIKDINDKHAYEAEVLKIKENYKKEINLSIKKINKLNDISVKRVRGNISRMMDIQILDNRIKNNSCNFFNENNTYHDKFHKYLYSSISSYLEEVKTYENNVQLDINTKEEFDDVELLKNTDNLYKRAAYELNTVAYLFSLSDQTLDDSNKKLSEQIKSDELIFQINAMLARSLNVVEMSPIECLLKIYGSKFDPNQGTNPNIKEIMGLLGGNIFILSEKDKKRKRTKFGVMNNLLKKDKEGKEERFFESEYDSYYSSDDDNFEDVPYRPIQIKSGKGSLNVPNKPQRRLWHKNQLPLLIIGDIQQKLKIGRSDWTYEAWIAFVYCFNERLKDIKLQFNPDNDYEKEFCYFNIDEAKSIIESFYPLYRILDFMRNEYKIQLFVGKNMKYAKEIFRAMIRAFDDADRVVTPIHMFRETYEQRTIDILNHIFNY